MSRKTQFTKAKGLQKGEESNSSENQSDGVNLQKLTEDESYTPAEVQLKIEVEESIVQSDNIKKELDEENSQLKQGNRTTPKEVEHNVDVFFSMIDVEQPIVQSNTIKKELDEKNYQLKEVNLDVIIKDENEYDLIDFTENSVDGLENVKKEQQESSFASTDNASINRNSNNKHDTPDDEMVVDVMEDILSPEIYQPPMASASSSSAPTHVTSPTTASTSRLQDNRNSILNKKKRKLEDVYDSIRDYVNSKSLQSSDSKRKNDIEMQILLLKKRKNEIAREVEECRLQQEQERLQQEQEKLQQERLRREQDEVKLEQEKIKLEIEKEKEKLKQLLRNNLN